MKAEQSLLDESIPFDFGSFYDCTCGHILRAVEGKSAYAGTAFIDDHPKYAEVIQEVALALGYESESSRDAVLAVSEHTADQGGGLPTRQDALNTVRTAMLALQPADSIVEYATA